MNTRYEKLLKTVGRGGLNALYPNDFEVYLISFELVDSNDKTIEFFSLPIMPSSLTIVETELTSTKKTNGGVVSLKSESFLPISITLAGNFGRNFKTLIRDKVVDLQAFRGGLGLKVSDFQGSLIKTGYGATKVFQKLLDDSKSLKGGKPLRLYMYNFTFNDNYVVEVVDKTFTQSKDSSNMIWNYVINLKAVAKINNSLKFKGSLKNILAANILQQGINTLASGITTSLNDN